MDTNKITNSIWLQQAKRLIEFHIDNNALTNEFLAKKLGISDRKFYRKIKEETGQTPNHYIRNIKLNKAFELLNTDQYLTVKEVVPLIGLKSHKYFYRIFKAQYGYPPGELLRKRKSNK